MRTSMVAGAGALALALVMPLAPALAQPRDEMRLDFTLSINQTPIADFQDEWSTSPAPFPPGWLYMTNAMGPLGNPIHYSALAWDPGTQQYSGLYGVRIGRSPADPVAYPPVPPFPPTVPLGYVQPGFGSLEDTNGIERAAIIRYTFQASDFAAAGVTGPAPVFITAYDFAVSTLSTPDGVSARVYAGDNPTPLIEFSDDIVPPFPFPPGFRFETSLDPDPIPLGNFNVGDSIYIAIGANNLSGIPEPAAISLLAPGALLLIRRRK